MRTYPDRRDSNYLHAAAEALRVERLMGGARAFRKQPYESESGATKQARLRYQRRCDLSFVGIAAANFFDCNHEYLRPDAGKPKTMAPEMEAIFKRHREFAEANVWLRLRFLFVYPYSTHAMSIIHAEATRRRTAMEGDRVHPSTEQHLHVAMEEFHSSTLWRAQHDSLTTIQEWMEKYEWTPEVGNSVEIRFTPTSPNLCGMIANDIAFSDSYLLAKKYRGDRRLVYSPVIEQKAGEVGFSRLEDHFRYLWQMNITLHCEDATHYPAPQPSNPANAAVHTTQDSLAQVRQPHEITFQGKADHLVRTGKIKEQAKHDWRFRTIRQFERHVTMPAPDMPMEGVFIGCCWEQRNGVNGPGRLARHIAEWLNEDITSAVKSFRPTLMQGVPGHSIDHELYGLLDSSLLGIVILTKRHKIAEGSSPQAPAYVASSNVYHELGYLMSRLEVGHRTRGRLLIGVEPGVDYPTNMADRVHVKLAPIEQLAKQSSGDGGGADRGVVERFEILDSAYFYCETLQWLSTASVLLADRKDILVNALSTVIARVQEAGLPMPYLSEFLKRAADVRRAIATPRNVA